MKPGIALIGLGILLVGMVLSWIGVVSDASATKTFAFFAAWFSIQAYSARHYPEWWDHEYGEKTPKESSGREDGEG